MKHLNNTKTMLLLAAAMFAGSTTFAQQRLFAANNIFSAPMAFTAVDESPNTLQLTVLQSADAPLTFHINVDNPKLDRARLLITDRAGNVLHEEMLPAKAHIETRYNLEMLEDGAYNVVVSTREKNISRAINIRTSVNRTISVQ